MLRGSACGTKVIAENNGHSIRGKSIKPTSGTPSIGATGWETSFVEQSYYMSVAKVAPAGADCNEGELKRTVVTQAKQKSN
jgi:hypothetical protein